MAKPSPKISAKPSPRLGPQNVAKMSSPKRGPAPAPPKQLAVFATGQVVRCHGLASAVELNGTCCTLVEYNKGTGRWRTQFPGGNMRNLKADNLEHVETGSKRKQADRDHMDTVSAGSKSKQTKRDHDEAASAGAKAKQAKPASPALKPASPALKPASLAFKPVSPSLKPKLPPGAAGNSVFPYGITVPFRVRDAVPGDKRASARIFLSEAPIQALKDMCLYLKMDQTGSKGDLVNKLVVHFNRLYPEKATGRASGVTLIEQMGSPYRSER